MVLEEVVANEPVRYTDLQALVAAAHEAAGADPGVDRLGGKMALEGCEKAFPEAVVHTGTPRD
jgi:hypothetical protein